MNSGRKNPFTEKEDELLVQYIAKNKPEPHGRTGNNLYINLVANEGNQWPWAKNHPWQSWRERYRKDQERFDYKIRKYQKQHIRMKSKKAAVPEEEEEKVEEEETAREKVASSSKTKLPSGHQPQAEGSSSRPTIKKQDEATTKNKTEGALEPERIVQAKPIPKPSPEKVPEEQDKWDRPEDVDQDPESLSDELMHDLFGSFVGEDEGQELNEPSPKQNSKSPQKVYPDVADLPAPTMDTTEPHMPGAFEIQPQAASQGPAKPKYVPAVHETPSNPPRPPPKKRKRKEEEDPFQTPSGTPPPVASKKIVPKQPPTIVEGPFRNTLKPTHESRTANNNDGSEWPPKRRKKNYDYYNVSAQPQQQQDITMTPRRPPHVNAVASSSKTQLPPSHATHHHAESSATVLALTKDVASSIPRSQTEPSLKPLGNDVLTHPSIEKKGAERRTLGDIPTDHHDQPPAAVEKPSQNAKDTRTVAQRPSTDNNELSSKAISRTGSHNLPTKPTSDNDPFTTNHVSDKAAGKARADPFNAMVVTKQPRRIDFYQENLSKRLRAKASFPSRRSSVVSSRTSTTSSTAKKTSRRSSSFRQSITALDIPDEEKRAFALAAAEDIASIMEQMAKDHGVSLEIAMKTYMRTRSIQNTKFILGQFLQTLIVKEQDLYAQMPDLSHVSDDEGEGEGDSDIPEGLVSNKTPEKAHTTHPQHSGASRRNRSNRPSLNIKPAVEVDDPVSDYSPPNTSRAGQFARLVKQNRKQEAIEREKRRVSGQAYQLTQLESPNKHVLPSREITVTPTPHRNSIPIPIPMEVDKPAEDDEDDIYVDEEQEQEQDADDESDSGNAQEDPRGPSPSVSSPQAQTLEELVLETYDGNPDLALEHQMLALNVNKDNTDAMRKFQARHDPDFLRFMSIRLVGEILAADAQDSDGEDYEE